MRSIISAQSEQMDLINMWVPQLAEHALFLHMLLNDAELKEKAGDIYMVWRDFYCVEKMYDMKELRKLLEELKNFKMSVLNRLKAGEWLGAAYPSFVEHIILELLYFEEKLNGKMFTVKEEVTFWNRINADHAGFASHLLDPVEQKLTDKADDTSKKIRALPIANIVMALEAGKELTEFNKQALAGAMSNKIKSVIPESLLRHVIREGEYGQTVLGKFVNAPRSPVSAPRVCSHK